MNSEAAILQLMHAQGLGSKTLMRLLGRLEGENRSVTELVAASVEELTETYGLSADTARSIASSHDIALELAEELYASSVKILSRGSTDYPDRLTTLLGDNAPPVLFAAGNNKLIGTTGVGFCGSREASEKSCQVTRESASALANAGYNVISGYARGVDLTAHTAALESGGTTTIVLATGILQFSAKTGIAEVMTPENSLILSEFPPKLPWAVHNAMRRNQTICALSRAMLLVESRSTGGTIEAGKAAIRLGVPLFVVDFAPRRSQSAGNRYLLDNGGRPLRCNSDTKPDHSELIKTLQTEPRTVKQESLFED